MNEKELEKIYNEAYKAVYWTAFALLKNEADAQDVVQDAFVTLIESYDTIQDKSKVLPWLKKIAANKSLNRLTRTRTDNADDEFFDDIDMTVIDMCISYDMDELANLKACTSGHKMGKHRILADIPVICS